MMNQTSDGKRAYQRTPDGQERLATRLEREDVNRRIGSRTQKRTVELSDQHANGPNGHREAGDQVNRFLLCALVRESSRHIKARTERAGQPLPMSLIVRGVLKSYRLEATDEDGPLQAVAVDIAALERLNDRISRSEVARYARDRARNSDPKLARGDRPIDDPRIKVERDRKQVIELRDRADGELR